ncbi:12253_t:CDS:2, partial [Dentiscutata heterogama]
INLLNEYLPRIKSKTQYSTDIKSSDSGIEEYTKNLSKYNLFNIQHTADNCGADS